MPQRAPADEIQTPQVRHAGRGALSLALLDARNRTLQLLSAFERAGAEFEAHAMAIAAGAPGATRAQLLQTVEASLEQLEQAGSDDASLNVFRSDLYDEDLRGEQLIVLAQSLQLPLQPPLQLELPRPFAPREPIGLPAMRWELGTPRGGFVPENETEREEVRVPEFEIDAQPVTWAQFVEFAQDGGYDRRELWREEGWAWLQAQEDRRAPRHVEQQGAAVLQNFFGQPRRLSAQQPVLHASWWEADAFARWAGRRIATEAEWEIAAHEAASRGFRWGDALEWTARGVLRGGSFATHPRQKHPKARRLAEPADDAAFTGFRTCAV
jgi:gamma-glutamyl hercynylcysteine S-oxide synthase